MPTQNNQEKKKKWLLKKNLIIVTKGTPPFFPDPLGECTYIERKALLLLSFSFFLFLPFLPVSGAANVAWKGEGGREEASQLKSFAHAYLHNTRFVSAKNI